MKRILLSAAALLATSLIAVACDDDDDDDEPTATTFNVTLTKAAETTTCVGAGAAAAGTATVTINAANTTITVTDVTFSGLSGPVQGAHIHSGAVGVPGPIAINFGATAASPLTSGFDDVFVSTDYLAPSGAPATFASFITAMKAGLSYINLHTAACPDGEIRGQLVASS
jgi:hypothetical protein